MHVLSGSTVVTAVYPGQKGSTTSWIASGRTCATAVASDHGADLGQVVDTAWPGRDDRSAHAAGG